MLMLNQGKWRTATELVNLIMALKRPLLDLSIGSIPRKHCLTGSNGRELIYINTNLYVPKIFLSMKTLTVKNEHLAFNCRQLKKETTYLPSLRRMALFILNKMKILDQW